MSSWPWIRGAKGITTPDDDPRPLVSDLIEKYRTEINQVKRGLAATEDLLHLYDRNKHDDLWILRFLRSHRGDIERAQEAALSTMLYRKQYNLDSKDIRSISPQMRLGDDVIAQYRNELDQVKQTLANDDFLHLYDPQKHTDHWLLPSLLSEHGDPVRAADSARGAMILEVNQAPSQDDDNDNNDDSPPNNNNNNNGSSIDDIHEVFQRFVKHGTQQDALTMVHPDLHKHGVVFYLNISSIDTHKLAEMNQEDWNASMAYVNEYQFQWNDYITRTTGRLTKACHIVDVGGIGLDAYNKMAQEKYASATTFLEDFYPQAVQAYLVCHAPIWIEAPWRILKPLLPRRVVSKLDFLNPKDYEQDHRRILEFIPDKLLPQRFGGKYDIWPPA